MATNPDVDPHVSFNVRIALPPKGNGHFAGIGSSYLFNLKPGELVRMEIFFLKSLIRK